ncbi:hypothetical protein N8000_09470, partial [Rhodospirillales bacterium]|nr:hypothetical protein [Rhodospirillales bacterium]
TVLLSNRALARQPQDHLTATSWRKRNQDDGCIDWRMPAEGIRNLIRALASPYVGAHCIFQSREIKIWKAEVVPATQDIEPGRVMSINSDALTVKAGIDALRLLEHEFDHLPGKASYIR